MHILKCDTLSIYIYLERNSLPKATYKKAIHERNNIYICENVLPLCS